MTSDSADRFEQLHHDHQHLNRLVDDLRAQLQACLREEGDSTELFATVEEFLAAAADELFEHFDAEESALFPYVVETLPDMAAKIRSLESGHDKICGTLTRMERFVAATTPAAFGGELDAFITLFARFDAHYSKHAREEHAMLHSIDEKLSDAERVELSKLLAEI